MSNDDSVVGAVPPYSLKAAKESSEQNNIYAPSVDSVPTDGVGINGNMVPDTEGSAEVEAAEQVINSMLYYKHYARAKMRMQAEAVKMSVEDRQLLQPKFTNHIRRMQECVEANQRLFDMLVNCAAHMFDETNPIQKAHQQTHLRPSTEHYMCKAKSTLKQIVRDWSTEGAEERRSCYELPLRTIEEHFPLVEDRNRVEVLVPGAGLARFAWELLQRGFSVTGNEFSIFMLLASNFILNTCQQVDELIIHPYVLDFANSFSYDEQLKEVHFPDVDPSTSFSFPTSTPRFSMCAGDFLQAYAQTREQFDCVATVFFLDTAPNPITYIRTIHRVLKPGGLWVNFGPLTYHFDAEDSDDALQLPFDELVRIVAEVGFEVRRVIKAEDASGSELPPSLYTCNPASMLQYRYYCGFFECIKLSPTE